MFSRLQQFVGELRMRRVFRTVGAYIALIWVLSQGFSDLFPLFGLPEWSLRLFVTIAVLAIPVVIGLAWRYEITSHGIEIDNRKSSLRSLLLTDDHHAVAPEQMTLATGSAGGVVSIKWDDPDGNEITQDFGRSFIIGREKDTDVRLDDPRVSRHHVRVHRMNDIWTIEDLNSSNGTYCDGQIIDSLDLIEKRELRLDRDGPKITLILTTADSFNLS